MPGRSHKPPAALPYRLASILFESSYSSPLFSTAHAQHRAPSRHQDIVPTLTRPLLPLRPQSCRPHRPGGRPPSATVVSPSLHLIGAKILLSPEEKSAPNRVVAHRAQGRARSAPQGAPRAPCGGRVGGTRRLLGAACISQIARNALRAGPPGVRQYVEQAGRVARGQEVVGGDRIVAAQARQQRKAQ